MLSAESVVKDDRSKCLLDWYICNKLLVAKNNLITFLFVTSVNSKIIYLSAKMTSVKYLIV